MMISERIRRLMASRIPKQLLVLCVVGAVIHSGVNFFIFIRAGLQVTGDPATLLRENLRFFAFQMIVLRPLFMSGLFFFLLMLVALLVAPKRLLDRE